ncbi:protein kinase [Myxococcota bacterium]|nr:protein kinase [Myxococcota bacterium]
MSAQGQPFGRYTLHERLGAGGMAEVWRATLTHQGVEKRLVIKRILRGLSADPAFLAMFIDEARIASLLHHPNIVQLYDLGEVDGEWYLAMEHVHGLNLQRVLPSLTSRRRLMPVELVATLGHEVARGLDAAHRLVDHDGRALKVVHRDICPANLLLSTQGDVKIVDFGVARSAANTSTTQGAGLKGHVAYMSPEQALGASLDGRSDLFGLGVVLWEALAGQRLFKTDSGLLTLERVRDAEVPPLPDGRVPPGLEAVVRRALARDPEDRFADARAMQLALAPFVGDAEAQRDGLAALVVEVLAAERAEESARLVALAPPPVADEEALTTVAAAPVAPKVAPSPAPAASPSPPQTAPKQTPAPRRTKALWLIPALLIALAVVLWPREEAAPPPREAAAPSPTPAAPTAPVETPPPPVSPPTETPAPAAPAAPAAPTPDRAPGGVTATPIPPERLTPTSPTLQVPVEVVPAPEAPAPTPAPVAATPAEPSPPAAEAPTELDPNTPALLTVTITQGLAELRIDGVKVKKKPPYTNISVPPGRHLVQVEVLSTGRVTSREVVLKPGETKELRFDLD